MESSLDGRWMLRWIAGSTIAAIAGGGAALGLVLGAHRAGVLGVNPLVALAVGAAAGLIAGSMSGAFEALLLPASVSRRTWMRATTAGAVLVWVLIAVTPLLLVDEPATSASPALARAALAICAGGGAGMLFAAFQAPALAALSVRTRPWLLGNGLGWGTATPLTYAVTGAPGTTSEVALTAVALLAVGGLAGGVATALTLRLEERRAQLIGQSTGRTCATELV